jgi:hypothetical protein
VVDRAEPELVVARHSRLELVDAVVAGLIEGRNDS